MAKNEFIVSRNLTKKEKILDIWFKSTENEASILKHVINEMDDITKINFYFDESINQVQMTLFNEIVQHLKSQVTVKLIFQSLHVPFERIETVITKLINTYTINIYYFSKGTLNIEFFGNDIVPYDETHNEDLYLQLKAEYKIERNRPIINEMRLKQELLVLKNDYDVLYDTYLNTHKRMQFAFRELHKFKRSAWTYKKKYLNNALLINNIERISHYKKKINKKNVAKGLKLIMKRVKSR
ncbi:hypothetical protein [Staphylococcus ratti]|uniref:Phage protein n=1 Tax=Staphylococcus ratti TaxID=2892440 RepID=A0ABY3PB22_9STAP|nr:hypothetical protein [Staphylococcus ratti]UEX89502.1 hypothetical protein LN051_07935 [Staphylococcus ratti]